jgi:hypothetical protein
MYPVDVTADYGDGMRSRGLAALGVLFPLKMLLAAPHLIILYVLYTAAGIIAWIGYWVVAFTGELPEFFFRFPERVIAWQVRTYGYLFQLTDLYPPFEWDTTQRYPVEITVAEGPGPRSRGLAVLGIVFWLKAFALIPHLIVLVFVGAAAVIANWLAFWIILFTGTFPRGMFDFVLGMFRWTTRLSAWLWTLTDEYPPFSLQA